MSELKFQKATKKQIKLRCAVFGPSGSGKTYSALLIAQGISKSIAVVDSERRSASKYADRFEFDVLDLDKTRIEDYIKAINAAAQAGYEVLILDSLTHAWQELLEEVEELAQSKFKGNSWSAWSKATPRQKALVDVILNYPGHIIATMRSKTEWAAKEEGGKSKPVRLGLAPEQGKGIEYEFDILLELNTDHIGTVIKDRTGKFQDNIIKEPGEDFGKALKEWLDSGEKPKTILEKLELTLASITIDEPNRIEAAREWLKKQSIVDTKLYTACADAIDKRGEELQLQLDMSKAEAAK